MRILGIESSSLVASTAIYEDGITMAEYTVDFKMTHSQTLLPMIDEMVKPICIPMIWPLYSTAEKRIWVTKERATPTMASRSASIPRVMVSPGISGGVRTRMG